ncbi:MAG: GntR family transcriptional regulator [Anaerolineaceae bacterium]|nr:GntR family transcriptional regulator [Anaerolineaceae bacterium]
MNIIISNASDDPIYQQIYDQICAQIIKGELAADTVLPPIRTVARELRISVITVKRAWEELERAGFIYTMAGKGCFVASLQQNQLADKQMSLAREKMAKDVAYYRSLGLTETEIVQLVKQVYKQSDQ